MKSPSLARADAAVHLVRALEDLQRSQGLLQNLFTVTQRPVFSSIIERFPALISAIHTAWQGLEQSTMIPDGINRDLDGVRARIRILAEEMEFVGQTWAHRPLVTFDRQEAQLWVRSAQTLVELAMLQVDQTNV